MIVKKWVTFKSWLQFNKLIRFIMNRIRAKLLITQEQFTNTKKDHPIRIQATSQPSTTLLQKFVNIIQEQSKSQTLFFAKMFNQFKSTLKNNRELLQLRDRKVQLPIPNVTHSTGSINQQVEKWLTNVCGQIFSIAFHHYLNGDMTFDQCKIYCSENILRNIALLSQNNELKPDLFQAMDKHIKNGILRYMMKKYPLTETINGYKELNSLVKQVDNYQKNQYDFFHYSHIVFELRESANYNDLIMKVINKKIKQYEVIEYSDNPEGEGLSNYQKFQKYFSKLLEQVYDPDWMTQIESQSKKNSLFFKNKIPKKGSVAPEQLIEDIVDFISCEEEKKHLPHKQREQYQQKQRKNFIQTLKYKEKVKQYTHILIGRKIPESVIPYNDKQINSLHLVIKSSSILRILTKWCEQLWKKFEHPDYYLVNHEQGLKVQRGGNINMISLQLKQSLSELMQDERQKIELFMNEIGKNNYEMQYSLMKKQLQNNNIFTFLEPLEKVCGVFSLKVVNNLHNYIITYLNRLIHGLLTVSDKWFKINRNLLKTEIWPSPPNLITLKIGDLMRCRCESKEREIINLYKNIVRLSKQRPEEIKIVRVKNRLNLSTNDILLNLLMFDKHICQIQLSIQSKKSRFHQYSNQFSHYLYQLQRSIFGPLTQLCSIWSTLDQRKTIYEEFVGSSYNNHIQIHQCEKQNKCKFKHFQRPFICSLCKVAYSHNNFIIKHLKCQNCNFWKCAKCQLAQHDQQTILENIVLNSEIRQDCKKISNYIYSTRDIPQYGFCIFICSKISKVQYFRKMKIKNKIYLFGQRDCGKIYEITDINSNKHLKQFIKNYIIFSLPNEIGSKQISVDREKANHQYLIIKYRNQVYSKERESICLQQQGITDKICQNLFREKAKQKQYIKRIDLQSNQITKIKVICTEFPHLKSLQLNQNKINNYEGLQNLKELQQLSISQNKLSEGLFPNSICKLDKLQVLNMQNTDLCELPQKIYNLKNLKMLELGNNLIRVIPNSFGELQNLQNLSIYSNQLINITEKIGNLNKLNTLILSNNHLVQVPQRISQLQNLLKLDIQGNQIQEINFSFARLQNIEELQLSNNKIKALPQDLGDLCYLKSLDVSINQLQKLPENMNWNKLMVLNLNQNQISKINDSLFKCSNLLKMEISNNLIQSLPQDIGNLKKLIVLNVSKNKLSVCPNNITHLQNLIFLSISQNQITKIPLNIGNLYKLQCFYASTNRITQIPFTIRRCVSLRELYLNDNLIKVIPQQLSNLTNIEHSQLDLSDNPLESVLCINYVLGRGDSATKAQIIEKLNIMPENQVINLKNIQLLKEQVKKKSIRNRKRQTDVEDLNKRSVSSNH